MYIPPSNSRQSSVELFEELDNLLLDFSDEEYCHILCGDFNAHTGTASDMVPISSYDLIEKDSYTQLSDLHECMQQTGIPTERYSTDETRMNDYGEKLLEMCKKNMMMCLVED